MGTTKKSTVSIATLAMNTEFYINPRIKLPIANYLYKFFLLKSFSLSLVISYSYAYTIPTVCRIVSEFIQRYSMRINANYIIFIVATEFVRPVIGSGYYSRSS